MIQTPIFSPRSAKMVSQTICLQAEMDAQHGLNNAHTLLHILKRLMQYVCAIWNMVSFGTEENEITFIITQTYSITWQRDKLTLAIKMLNEAKKLADY
ncbi:MAG: hypothetical protein LGB01_03450 [Sulfurovum sp.]|nr:hypothetical protein [Sulfurovum sp.]